MWFFYVPKHVLLIYCIRVKHALVIWNARNIYQKHPINLPTYLEQLDSRIFVEYAQYLLFWCVWNTACRDLCHINYRQTFDITDTYNGHPSRDSNCWSLRCNWSIACRGCSNYIFILYLTSSLNGLDKNSCLIRRDTFIFCDLVVWYYRLDGKHTLTGIEQ